MPVDGNLFPISNAAVGQIGITATSINADTLETAQPVPSDAELFDTLLRRPGLRIERIISTGQRTPEGEWYDQVQDEWVVLLTGAARLRFDSSDSGEWTDVELLPGDYVNIPAHRRHRVEWTDPGVETVWLAVHYGEV